ncbi:MAG: chitobiase/beta-hexosaminidase C-terminal domain-containing protein, partial [Muribaculaceae bacterium]|nr:chitobiase/beta-hexosaminidase C-terminal domain-containing protein [Muribaculaceae bacterium]
MKKLLLTLFAVLGLVTANAGTVTFDFTSNDYGLPNDGETYVTDPTTITQDGVSITFTGSWRMWTDGLREYYKNGASFEVSANGKNVTKVSWTVVSGATFALDGTTTNITEWTGSATSVKFNTTASANKAVETITVEFDGEGGGNQGGGDEPVTPPVDPDPDPQPTDGDVLTNAAILDANTQTYGEYTYTGASGAVYALQCAGSYGSIQLRSNNNNSGVVVTKSAGNVKSISVTFNENTTANRVVNVYASNTAYTAPSDLYAAGLTPVATFTYDGTTKTYTYTFTEDYAYVGIRSSNGALYLDNINVVWGEGGNTGGGDEPVNPPVDPQPGEGGTVTYDTAAQGYTNSQKVTSYTSDGVTFTMDKGTGNNDPAYYNTGSALRLYGGNTMTISVATGNITNVAFTFSSGEGTNAITASEGSYDAGNWTGSASEVIFTVGGTSGHRRVATVTVTYVVGGEAPAVAAPTFKMIEGEYCHVLEITSATEGAAIYYTTDGTNPTTASTLYTAPIEIWEKCTVKAIAVADGQSSNVASYNATPVVYIENFSPLSDFPTGTNFIINGKMTAVYQNGSNTIVRDVNGTSMLVYGYNQPELANGDTFNKLEGTYSPYNELPEITNPVYGEITKGGTPVEALEYSIEEVTLPMLFTYMTLTDVDITDVNARNYNITSGDVTVAGYDNFNLGNITEDMEGVTVRGFVGAYKGNLQFWVTEVVEYTLEAPVFNPASGATVTAGQSIEITAAEGTVYWMDLAYEEYGFEPYDADACIIPYNARPGSTVTFRAYAATEDGLSKTVEAVYTVAGKADPQLVWTVDGETVTEFTYDMAKNTVDDLPKLEGIISGELTITSSNEAVATINDELGVDILAAGTTVITATLAETSQYAAATASFTLTVVGNEVEETFTQLLSNPGKLKKNILEGEELGASEGWSMQCMNTEKNLESSNTMTLPDGTKLISIKTSNGAQNTVTLPSE